MPHESAIRIPVAIFGSYLESVASLDCGGARGSLSEKQLQLMAASREVCGESPANQRKKKARVRKDGGETIEVEENRDREKS
jgi:hypothetical protein